MDEPVVMNEEAGKENEQMLAILSLAEQATSKDEVKIEKFLQVQKSKNTQHKTKSDLKACKKFCESLKESRTIDHFTVVSLVTWPWTVSEAGVDLVLIETSLLFICKSCCSYAN